MSLTDNPVTGIETVCSMIDWKISTNLPKLSEDESIFSCLDSDGQPKAGTWLWYNLVYLTGR